MCKIAIQSYNLLCLQFGQNSKMRQKLFRTIGTTLAEASPMDAIWGIGLAEEDPAARDKSQWPGTNWLGIALMEVRDELMKKFPQEAAQFVSYSKEPAHYVNDEASDDQVMKFFPFVNSVGFAMLTFI